MKKHIITYGFGIAAALIVYFLLTKLVGLHKYPILSAFNAVIIGAGIFYALRSYKRASSNFRYQNGFQVGLFAGSLAAVLLAVFMACYIFMIDVQFASAVLDSWNMNFNKGSLILIISLTIMGISTTFVLTLAFMQLLKDSWNQ